MRQYEASATVIQDGIRSKQTRAMFKDMDENDGVEEVESSSSHGEIVVSHTFVSYGPLGIKIMPWGRRDEALKGVIVSEVPPPTTLL